MLKKVALYTPALLAGTPRHDSLTALAPPGFGAAFGRSATERFQLVALAVAFLCVGSAMASFDVVRARAGRPIAGGRDAIQLYWIVYLAMFVLAITSAVAAIVR